MGKTALSVRLATHYNTVILSCDSRQFYRQLNIGTAKPNAQELLAVRHYFINNKDVGDLYGAGHFASEALTQLGSLFKTHNLVIASGGSGLYINALLNGVDDFEDIPLTVRQQLNTEYAEKGLTWLQEELNRVDPAYFNKVDRNNPQRMIRALEVFRHTGSRFSSFLSDQKQERGFTPIPLLINLPREVLYERINKRVDHMMEQGLADEVRSLVDKKNFNALKTVGYKELFEHFDGRYTLSEAVDKIKQHTRNYAKRQVTWFRNRGGFEEFEPDADEKIKAYVDLIMSHG